MRVKYIRHGFIIALFYKPCGKWAYSQDISSKGYESAKLHALHTKAVFACQRALRANVLTCQLALHVYLPTCLRANVP